MILRSNGFFLGPELLKNMVFRLLEVFVNHLGVLEASRVLLKGILKRSWRLLECSWEAPGAVKKETEGSARELNESGRSSSDPGRDKGGVNPSLEAQRYQRDRGWMGKGEDQTL